MTIESRGTIEPKDIVAIEFECVKCHAKVIRPLSQPTSTVPAVCGNCQEMWFIDGRQEINELRHFLGVLERYKNGSFPFILRFEVKDLGGRANG